MNADAVRLSEIEAVYERGLYLDAFRELRALGAPEAARTSAELILTSRVLNNVGAPKRGRLLAIRAHRVDRLNPSAAYYFASVLADVRGPWAGLSFLRRFVVADGATDEERALLLLQTADLLGRLRDFEEAERLWRAAAATWEHAYLWVERSALLQRADAPKEAHEAAARALELGPAYRPALQQMAQVLSASGDSEAAERLLAERGAGLQSPYLLLHLSHLRYELGRAEAAREALGAAVAMMPWPEDHVVRGVSALAANIHCKLGDVDAAIRFGLMEGSPAHLRLAARLGKRLPERRVLLAVPWVRQAHKTCAPATLTSLCGLHGHPAEQVSIVEEICYDGTPAAMERRWAESHGLVARQFTVTWDAAVALLDEGLAFSLLTFEAGSAHLQAVAGYDLARGVFLVRDPSTPVLVEMDAEAMLARQAFAGPQGMAVAPRGSTAATALAALSLPEADAHDGLYRLQLALLEHQRGEAVAELDALTARAAGSVVTMAAKRALASYDGNQAALLVAFEEISAAHPGATPPLLGRLSCLENLARAEQRRSDLKEAAHLEAADPIVRRMWGQELARDGRHHASATLWLREVVRRMPHDATAYALLGNLAAVESDLPGSWALARAAACIDDTNEGLAWHYFRQARVVGRPEEGLGFLRRRVERLGKRAAAPWQTLQNAYLLLDRVGEAEEVLASMRAARPEDGEALLVLARAALRRNRVDESRELAARAEGRVRPIDYVRLAAELDRRTGDRSAAISRWRSVLATDPLSLEAHAAVTRLLAESGDRAAGLRHLTDAAASHPHHAGLARLAIDFTDDEGEEGLGVVRRLVALEPTDAWARRELAARLARRHRLEEALVEADHAVSLEPNAASTHGIRAYVLAAAGRREEAREAYRAALSRDADYVFAFQGLLDEENDLADRLRAIRFLQKELRRQIVFGNALPALRLAARGLLPDDEILAFLEEAREARPDLRSCWDAVVDQLVVMGRLDEARARARGATERFPLVVEPLLQLAEVEQRRGDGVARREALGRALEVEPGHIGATRALADALADAGELDRAIALADAACSRSPLEVVNHGVLANLLARARRLPQAFAVVRRALELEPSYEWAWSALARWASEPSAQTEALAVADGVVTARPDAAAAHLGRARLLGSRPGRADEALAAIDRAIACEPRSIDAHDQRAQLLANMGRLGDALLACRPAAFGERPPVALRGRRAWVLARQGSVDDAIEEMEVTVAENPLYLWGFLQLADWYFARGKVAGARRACERALHLAPTSPEAALGLFDACFDVGDYAACRRALDACRDTAAPPFRLAREVKLACRLRQPKDALESYGRLAAMPQPSSWPLVEAGRALVAAGRDGAVRKILEGVVLESGRDRPDAADLGIAWAKTVGAHDELRAIRLARRLVDAGRAGQEALGNHVEDLGERRNTALLVLMWLGARASLKRSARVWGAFGYALVKMGWMRLATRWQRDHAARADAKPWMLSNVVVALLARGRRAEARAVSEHAVTLPRDNVGDLHLRWLAFHAALDGRDEEARARLPTSPPAAKSIDKLLDDYTRALLGANADEAADPARRRAALDKLDAGNRGRIAAGVGLIVRRVVRSAVGA
jgi:tetratricopeptide (TPR) repeat protein